MDSVSVLPTGGCNFRNLAAGIALSCGCQKFWLRRKRRRAGKARPAINGKELSRIGRVGEGRSESARNGGSDDDDDDDDDDEECRCGHHACYHSFDSPVSTHPVSIHHPQQTGRRYSLQVSDTETSLRLDHSGANLAASGFSITSGSTTERGYSATEPSPFVARHHHYYHHTLGPAPVYQPSHLSSRSASKSATGRGDQFRDVLIGAQSILELPCPTDASTAAELAELRAEVMKLRESVHERLETVETFAFAIEEMRDKVELAEDRANEVEEKVSSFENRLDDRLAPLEKRKPRETDEDGVRPRKRRKEAQAAEERGVEVTTTTSFTTTASTSTSFCSTASSRDSRADEATTSHLLSVIERVFEQRFEPRFVDIESALPPSISRPWVVEAILLPPAPLRGVWTDPATTTGGYESSNAHSVSTISGTQHRRKSTSSDTSSDSSNAPSSPQPRSFAVDSRLYRRLLTRGFIKTILILGPTAHDVSTAITDAFGPLLEWCHSHHSHHSPHSSPSPWQPLRKVHKQTTLEFLKSSESASALWNVEFLKGTCVMRGRRRALYITPSQPPPTLFEGLTWADVRALPPTSDDNSCWEWKEALDEAPAPVPVPAHAGNGSDAAWSSFGPFQREDAPLSPPVPNGARKRPQGCPPPGIEGLTPALTGEDPPSVRRQGSGLSGLSVFEGLEAGGEWELSPRTMGWFIGNLGEGEGGGGGEGGM